MQGISQEFTKEAKDEPIIFARVERNSKGYNVAASVQITGTPSECTRLLIEVMRELEIEYPNAG